MMRFSEFEEVHEFHEPSNITTKRSDGKPSDPGYYVKQKLELVKTMSPDALNLKLRKGVRK